MPLYSKVCIMCNREFTTTRISTVFCNTPPRKCANASRKLPVKMKEQLIKRSQQFTMSIITQATMDRSLGGDTGSLNSSSFTQAELQKAAIDARNIVRERDIQLTEVQENNMDFINPTDPALGNSNGFGQKENTTTPVTTEDSKEDTSTKTQPTNITITKGIRRIGGIRR